MSKTDKTRPYQVQMADRPIQTSQGIPLIGGLNSEGGHNKEDRAITTSQRRARDRAFCTEAERAVDTESLDLLPHIADKRSLARRH